MRSPGFFSHASFPCGLPCSFSWLCSASRWDTVPCIYLVIVLCVYSGVPEDLPDVTNILANSPMPGELLVEEWNCTLPGTRLLILPRATSVAVCILCRTGCRFASRRAGSSTGFLRCLGLRRSLSRLSACGVLHHGLDGFLPLPAPHSVFLLGSGAPPVPTHWLWDFGKVAGCLCMCGRGLPVGEWRMLTLKGHGC